MAGSDRRGFACSSNGIYYVGMKKLITPSNWETNKSVMDYYGKMYAISTPEIKRDSLMKV